MSARCLRLRDLLFQVSQEVQRVERLELVKICSPQLIQHLAIKRSEQHLLMIPSMPIARTRAVDRTCNWLVRSRSQLFAELVLALFMTLQNCTRALDDA